MIKMNNTMLEMFMGSEAKEGRAAVFLFTGTIPTKAELNEFMSTSDVKQLTNWKAWMTAREDSPVLIGELSCEQLVNANFQSVEQIVVPFAGDPAEMQVRQAGIPTWMMVHVCEKGAGQSDMYYDSWGSDEVLYSIVGTVGDVGTGADIEIVDGEIIDGNTYKVNNLVINLSEQ